MLQRINNFILDGRGLFSLQRISQPAARTSSIRILQVDQGVAAENLPKPGIQITISEDAKGISLKILTAARFVLRLPRISG
jgi:hypothetical protein